MSSRPTALWNSDNKNSKTFLRAYSSGNCSGFSPDSLFIRHLAKPVRGKSNKSLIPPEKIAYLCTLNH